MILNRPSIQVSSGLFRKGDEKLRMLLSDHFSFVTLTSLGYGDITPVTDHARSLAFLEAIVGNLYLAVLVARLVGMYRPHSDVSTASTTESKSSA